MSFAYLTNTPLEQAKAEYLRHFEEAGFGPREETLPVAEAHGRVTARAVYARISAPHYAAAAMDGAALAAKDTFGATETTPVTLDESRYTIVDTGDPVPEGCDAVVMAEDLVFGEDGALTLRAAAAPWQHIRQIGEDICAGEMILGGLVTVTPAAIGALIAGGVRDIAVIRRPVVGLIPTGDEIVPPGSDPGPGEILEFNSAIFSAMLRDWGAMPKTWPIVPDRPEAVEAALARAVAECDMVVLNAGASAGRDDGSAAAVARVGRVLRHGVAIRPGKPAILGAAGAGLAKPVLGAPGYPVSGILVLEEFLLPLVRLWFGQEEPERPRAEAVLGRPVVSGLKYREFVRARLGYVGDRLVASPLARGAGVVSSFMKADGILEAPQGCEGYAAGETVTVRLLTEERRLRNTLMVIGSHDPLLDELADLLHRRDRRLYMSSSHVGSLGGIMALRRGEAHAAGCHLLDTETGEYNKSYLRKYFPNGGVRLVRCVGRQQGLMVRRGNPLGITGIRDLAGGPRYVNRQKGSGTRILLDWLLAQNGLDGAALEGYAREELTHTSVAVQIASGSADAGLGILSAARLYDLDFLPLCVEEYDLLIPDAARDTPPVRALLDTLASAAFRDKLLEMGGYTLDAPGEEIEWQA